MNAEMQLSKPLHISITRGRLGEIAVGVEIVDELMQAQARKNRDGMQFNVIRNFTGYSGHKPPEIFECLGYTVDSLQSAYRSGVGMLGKVAERERALYLRREARQSIEFLTDPRRKRIERQILSDR